MNDSLQDFAIIDNPNDLKRVRFVWNKVNYVVTLAGEVFEDPGGYKYPTNTKSYELQAMINGKVEVSPKHSGLIEEICARITMKKL